MKLSIITISFNSGKTIESTVKSVLTQTYNNIEYIIIDGGSTDATMDIVNSFGTKISKIISEPDVGMYDAMNKGIKLATGDVVGILNSDDIYVDNNVLKRVAEEFEKMGADCAWGDLEMVDKNDLNKVVRNWKSGPYKEGSFQQGWHPPHPGFFVKKEIYEKYGLFRTDMNTWADYELQLRFLEKEKITSSYIPQTLVKMRAGGKSSKSIWHQIKANFGCYRAFRTNGLRVNPLFIIKKPLFKFTQYF